MPNRAIRIKGAVLDAWKRVTGIELDDGAAANGAIRTAVTLPERGVLRGPDGMQVVVPDLTIAAKGDGVNIRDSSDGQVRSTLRMGGRGGARAPDHYPMAGRSCLRTSDAADQASA